jgi:hypothetical protein
MIASEWYPPRWRGARYLRSRVASTERLSGVLDSLTGDQAAARDLPAGNRAFGIWKRGGDKFLRGAACVRFAFLGLCGVMNPACRAFTPATRALKEESLEGNPKSPPLSFRGRRSSWSAYLSETGSIKLRPFPLWVSYRYHIRAHSRHARLAGSLLTIGQHGAGHFPR